MNNTKSYEFFLKDKKDIKNLKEYVVLTAGKGKKDHNYAYIRAEEFSYIEGLVWNKFREYGIYKLIKISSSDWVRIIEGFEEASKALSNAGSKDDMEKTLRLRKFDALRSTDEIVGCEQEVNQLLTELCAWLSTQIKKQKYITIEKEL